MTHMRQDPEIESEMSDTVNHIDSIDKRPESQQDDQAGNTTSHGYNLRLQSPRSMFHCLNHFGGSFLYSCLVLLASCLFPQSIS